MNIVAIYILGVLVTFAVLAIAVKIGGMSNYSLCLQWAVIWFLIPLLAIIFIGCMILLAIEDVKENERGVEDETQSWR